MELALLPLVMETGKPVLGICRGVQLLNIGLGGTIWQDIPSQVKSDFPLAHTQPFAYTLPSHTVTVKPGSRLAEITGAETLSVNSMHHQAVKDVAPASPPRPSPPTAWSRRWKCRIIRFSSASSGIRNTYGRRMKPLPGSSPRLQRPPAHAVLQERTSQQLQSAPR